MNDYRLKRNLTVDPGFGDLVTTGDLAVGQTERYLSLVEGYCRRMLAEAAAAGVSAEAVATPCATVHDGIIAAAAHHGCDLIFMASHGRRGIGALLLGSETQKVLTHSTIPVLVHR